MANASKTTNNINEDKVLRLPSKVTRDVINSLDDYYKGIHLEKLPIDKLVKDNDLLNDDDLQSYHKSEWKHANANDFHIDMDKINSIKTGNMPFVIKKKDGRLLISDGRHRTRAAYNDGYTHVEFPTYNEEKINESIHLVDEENKNVFYTKEVYDLKNYIVNNVSKDVIKICDYVSQGLYVFCNAYNGIHEMLEEMAQEQGLVDSSNDIRYVAYTGTTEDDDYETIDYSDGIVYDYGDFKIFEVTLAMGKSKFIGSRLQKALGQYKSKYRLVNGSFRRDESINESLLLEKNRQDLLNKSRASDNYSSKDRQGENRYTRRLKSQIANSVRDYNRIDMDAFWKGDILDFDVRVHGETDDYVVSLDFSNILRRLQQEVSANKNRLEFKCVLRALVGAFNSDSDLLVSCTCPDWKYRQAYWATRGGYNSGQPQPSNGMAIANPNDTKGAGCKHVNLVLSNLDWMMKIASVINNYIKWTRDNMGRNYADYIFPKVYGMPYKKAVQLSLLDKEDKFGDAILPSDIDTINQAIERGMIGKDDQGKFVKGNEYRFQKTTKHQPEDNPDQMKLDLDNEEEDKEVNKSVADIEKEKNVKFTKDEPQEPEEDKEANIRFEK